MREWDNTACTASRAAESPSEEEPCEDFRDTLEDDRV